MRNLALILGVASTLTLSAQADEKWDAKKIDATKLPAVAAKKGVTYAKDIKPLFEASCFGCHGDNKQKGEFRADSLEAILKGGEHGKMVVPGDSKKSLLTAALAQTHDEIAMPPKPKPRGPGGPGAGRPPGGGPGGPGGPGGGFTPPKPLTAEQVGLVRAWIDQGAK